MTAANLTPKMRYALDLLRSSNEERHAVTCTQPTRPVGENDVFVNVSTARALAARGLLEFSGGGDEPGYEWVWLTEAGRAIPGWASYRCVNYDCRHEWDGRAEMYEGQMDPSAVGRADDCPKCGTESDEVTAWTPENYGRAR